MSDGFVIAGELMLHSGRSLRAFPRPDDHLLMDGVSLRFGGPAFNMARNLVQLGRKVSLTGPAGAMDRHKLEREGPGHRTTAELIWVEGHSDLLFTVRSGGGHFSLYQRAEVEPEHVNAIEVASRRAGVLVLTGSRHECIRNAYVRLLEGSEVKLVLAPNYALGCFDGAAFRRLFERATVAALNENETELACKLLGCAHAGELAERASGTLIVTRASNGAEVFRHGSDDPIFVPSISERADDVFGAGDAFLSGFLDARYEQELDVADAAFWAGAMAGVFAKQKRAEDDLPPIDRATVEDAYRRLRETRR